VHHPNKVLSLAVLFAAMAVAVGAHGAWAQQCVNFQALPENASLIVRGARSFASGSPGTFCSLEPGVNYRLTMAHPGYETRNLKLRLNAEGEVDISGVWAGPMFRSTLVPGWGQYTTGNKVRGSWAFIIGAGSGAYLLWSYVDYQDARDNYDSIVGLAESATTQAELLALQEAAALQAADANVKRSHYQDVLIMTAYIHVSNIAEAYLLARPPKASVDGSVISLEVAPKTRTKATVRSILFPGLGQKYMGNHGRGWFFQSLFLGVGVWAIEERQDYLSAQKEYEFDQQQLDNASTISEIEAARLEAEESWDKAQKRERRRNWSYIALGTAYLWNVIDASFVGEPSSRGGKIGFETSFRGPSVDKGTFGTALTWRF
jgi:hypothetical protein